MKRELAKLIGESFLLASLQSSWGSVEMSSKFSVLSFSKDQDTLQRAMDALKNYILVGIVWTFACMLTLYATHGINGIIAGFITNMIMMAWIVGSYIYAFNLAASRNGLVRPALFTAGDILPAAVIIFIGLFSWVIMWLFEGGVF